MAKNKSKSNTNQPPPKDRTPAVMLIRQPASAETFLAAYGKKHGANLLYDVKPHNG